MVVQVAWVASFANAVNTRGYIHVTPGDKADGSHSIALVGYVLPSALPKNAPRGDGKGYFIVKNSHGCGWGDGGYGYVSRTWLEKWGLALSAIADVR